MVHHTLAAVELAIPELIVKYSMLVIVAHVKTVLAARHQLLEITICVFVHSFILELTVRHILMLAQAVHV